MRLFIFLTVILLTYTAYASCPINETNSACMANSQTSIPDLVPSQPALFNPAPSKTFLGTPDAVKAEREIAPTNNLRNFGATNQDYGYNSSCQFGVCMDTGTPKNFTNNQNRE